jgi:hypothetical protein
MSTPAAGLATDQSDAVSVSDLDWQVCLAAAMSASIRRPTGRGSAPVLSLGA